MFSFEDFLSLYKEIFFLMFYQSGKIQKEENKFVGT